MELYKGTKIFQNFILSNLSLHRHINCILYNFCELWAFKVISINCKFFLVLVSCCFGKKCSMFCANFMPPLSGQKWKKPGWNPISTWSTGKMNFHWGSHGNHSDINPGKFILRVVCIFFKYMLIMEWVPLKCCKFLPKRHNGITQNTIILLFLYRSARWHTPHYVFWQSISLTHIFLFKKCKGLIHLLY